MVSISTPAKDERQKNTKEFFPKESTPPEDPAPFEIDSKISVYTVSDRYRPLKSATSPNELLEGIADAILGHNALWQRGWLHRDVNLGNVMLLPERVPRERHELWSEGRVDCDQSGKTYFIGVLNDGDHVVRCKRGSEGPRSKQRSGTLPYISRRLLIAWYETPDISLVHLAADDLESFAWTLLFATLQITKERGIKWTTAEGRWYRDMRDRTTLYDMSARKHSIIARLKQLIDRNNPTAPSFSPIISHFAPLLDEWFDLASTWANKANRFESTNIPLQDIESFDKECYKSCIALILSYLPKIPDTWPDVPLASGS
ncbi:hypothetical protein BDZ97DRAFT_1915576 [Flammula alnicola]|nr:hypothetical protein BDZ97DRAFT_1915576 [Flammula alnicola]